MVAQHLLPHANITFELLSEVANWRKGYVVWEFPVWKWLMDRGVCIADYDIIDYDAWSKEGPTGLKRSVSPEEFTWYEKNTFDLNEVTKHIQQSLTHSNFTHFRKKPAWDDVVAEYKNPGICDIVLNSRTLNRQEGFAAHRVVIVEIIKKRGSFSRSELRRLGQIPP